MRGVAACQFPWPLHHWSYADSLALDHACHPRASCWGVATTHLLAVMAGSFHLLCGNNYAPAFTCCPLLRAHMHLYCISLTCAPSCLSRTTLLKPWRTPENWPICILWGFSLGPLVAKFCMHWHCNMLDLAHQSTAFWVTATSTLARCLHHIDVTFHQCWSAPAIYSREKQAAVQGKNSSAFEHFKTLFFPLWCHCCLCWGCPHPC